MDENEQMRVLQEKIKNMSPEELKDFQKKQCIFCQIIAGKVQSKKIYEDENVIAVLDINPANPGHLVLMTKEHYSIMPQLPEEMIAHTFIVARSLSNSMLRSLEAQGTNIIVANGVTAGQRAQHFMVHIIPRKEKDGVEFTIPQKQLDEKEIEDVGNKLGAALGVAGAKVEPPITVEPKEVPMPQPAQPHKESHKGHSHEGHDHKKPERKKIKMDFDDIAKRLGVK